MDRKSIRSSGVLLACALLCLSSSTFAQTRTSDSAPTARVVIDDWAGQTIALKKTLRSYQLQGRFRRTVEASKEHVHHETEMRWQVDRDGNRYRWDVTTGAFDWNPRSSPDSMRWAVSFDGFTRHHLTKEPATPYEKKRGQYDPPGGTIKTVPYEASHRPKLVSPRTLDEIKEKVQPVYTTVDGTAPTPEDAFRSLACYPLEPYEIYCDPVHPGDTGPGSNGAGDIVTAFRKRLAHLSISGPESVDHQVCWRVRLPPEFAQSALWLPESILFTLRNAHWVPARFECVPESLPGGNRTTQASAFGTVTVTQFCGYQTVSWPCAIRSETKVLAPNSAEVIATGTVDKTIETTRINDHFSAQELTVVEPSYARVNQNGRLRPPSDIPAPPSNFWYLFSGSIAAVATVLAVFFVARRSWCAHKRIKQ